MAGRCTMTGLRSALERYLSMRQGLGYKYQQQARRLASFVSFMEERKATIIKAKLAMAWATLPPDRHASWALRLTDVRGFARHVALGEEFRANIEKIIALGVRFVAVAKGIDPAAEELGNIEEEFIAVLLQGDGRLRKVFRLARFGSDAHEISFLASVVFTLIAQGLRTVKNRPISAGRHRTGKR